MFLYMNHSTKTDEKGQRVEGEVRIRIDGFLEGEAIRERIERAESEKNLTWKDVSSPRLLHFSHATHKHLLQVSRQ